MMSDIIGFIGGVLALYMFAVWYSDYYFVKNMTLEQAQSIALEAESDRKLTYSLKAYIKARKMLLDNGYWKMPDGAKNHFSYLSGGDYIKDLITGELK